MFGLAKFREYLNFLHCSFAIRHKKVEMVVVFHLHVLLLCILMNRTTCHVFHLHKVVFVVMIFSPLPSKLRPSHLTLCLVTMGLKMHCLLLCIYKRKNVHIRKEKNVHIQKLKCAFTEAKMRIYGRQNVHIRKRASVYAHLWKTKCAYTESLLCI